jgi:hypothetical protein
MRQNTLAGRRPWRLPSLSSPRRSASPSGPKTHLQLPSPPHRHRNVRWDAPCDCEGGRVSEKEANPGPLSVREPWAWCEKECGWAWSMVAARLVSMGPILCPGTLSGLGVIAVIRNLRPRLLVWLEAPEATGQTHTNTPTRKIGSRRISCNPLQHCADTCLASSSIVSLRNQSYWGGFLFACLCWRCPCCTWILRCQPLSHEAASVDP